LDEAEKVCRRAVEMNPQSASALYNLANVLLPLGKVDETQAIYDRVVALDPAFPKGHWNRGLCYLVQGKFAEGWTEYEWRELADEVVIDKYDAPLWDGKSSLRDKFILLHSEQGVGDEMMFATCYPDVIRQAGRVMITCDPRLKNLFKRSFPEAAVVAMRRALGDKLTTPEGLDCHLPVGSLPLYLRQRPEDFPGTPYLKADPDMVAMWRERFARLGPEVKIGVSWRAGGLASEQRRRTSPLDHWAPMFRLPGVKFVNLQYGKCEDDLKRAREEFGMEIHHWDDANPLKDLEAAAAQIEALDMVISVGNTTIHMAGALGKETWVALPHVPGWRYLLRGEKMPWYGSVRLMRQAEDRDWGKLLKRMAGELDTHLGLSSLTRRSRPLNVGWEQTQQELPTKEPALDSGNDIRGVEISEQIQRAVANHQAGDFVSAERNYRDVLSAQPDCLDALYLLGTLTSQTGRLVEAIGLLQQTLQYDAQRPEVHYNLANALRKAENREQAEQHYRRAIELFPEFSLAHLNLGATLDELGRAAEALESYTRAAEIDPELAEAHHNRGSVLVEMGRLDEAVVAYQRAVELKPDYTEAHARLGGTLRALGQLDEAKASYDVALRLRPDDADTRVNRAMLLLQQGQFGEGWGEYEWRWGAADGPRPRSTSLPTWNGESLTGKTLLVWGEQGIGDEIMFASCVGEVAAMARHCILECSPRLVSLLARSLPEAIVVAPGTTPGGERGVVDERADVQIAAGSLPRLLRKALDSFPRRDHFLVADPLRCQQWRAWLAELGPGLNVGISWRSGSDGPDRGQRTIDLALWHDLIATEGARFVNLQNGDVESEIAEFQQATGLNIYRWADDDDVDEFDELAARVASLDLVISVANATVHLAGGLGVDTWTLTPMAPSWRWLAGTSTSPWYPRMSVYSQARRDDWQGVLGDVRQRLARRLAEDRHTDSYTNVDLQTTTVRRRLIAAPHLGLGHLQGTMGQQRILGQSNQPAG
jgi:tetratricopeptide (TPR) repeat protein